MLFWRQSQKESRSPSALHQDIRVLYCPLPAQPISYSYLMYREECGKHFWSWDSKFSYLLGSAGLRLTTYGNEVCMLQPCCGTRDNYCIMTQMQTISKVNKKIPEDSPCTQLSTDNLWIQTARIISMDGPLHLQGIPKKFPDRSKLTTGAIQLQHQDPSGSALAPALL